MLSVMYRYPIALFVILCFSTASNADTLAICAKAEGPPKHYVDASGTPRGYAIDIAAEALRRAGYEPQIRSFPWKRAQNKALEGACVITAFSKTETRLRDYLYTNPMYVDRVLLWQSAKKPFTFDGFDDLTGKQIGIALGSQYSGEFERVRPRLHLHEDTRRSTHLRMLIAGRLDGAIFPGDVAAVRYLAEGQGTDISDLVYSETPISIDPNHIGVPKRLRGFDPSTVVEDLNAALASMDSDGTITRFLDRYR